MRLALIERLIGAVQQRLGGVAPALPEPAMPMVMVMLSLPGARLMTNGVVSMLWRRRSAIVIGEGDVGIGHHHHEFLAAIAAGQIDAAHIGGDAAGEFLQHFVADVVAVGVVDRLEVVDVHDDEGERLARSSWRLRSDCRDGALM